MTGNAVGSSPVTDRSTMEMFYQLHETAYADRQDERVPPNHYPLVTRSGLVPVAQLSDRGLFSQSRYRSDDLALGYAGDDPGPGIAEVDTQSPSSVQFVEEASYSSPPLALADGLAQVTGQAKTIDVQATLAMR